MSYKNYTAHSAKKTHQTQPVPGKNQIKNDSVGYVFQVSDNTRLERFLVLGATGSTYYISQQKHTCEELNFITDLIKRDGVNVVNKIVEISDQGRSMKNDHAIYALALCLTYGDLETKTRVEEVFDKIIRIGAHLLMFVDSLRSNSGMGRAKKRIISNWFQKKDADSLAYQVSKYFSRYGYSMHDILRLVKPVPQNIVHNSIYKWIKDRTITVDAPKLLSVVEHIKTITNKNEVVDLVKQYRLGREHIPTQWSSDPDILQVMLPTMPMTALLRNLPSLTKHGLFKPMSSNLNIVKDKLTNPIFLSKARIHPINVLKALVAYSSGQSVRGSATWTPNQDIVDILDDSFYKSFKCVKSTGKRILLALDVSHSMSGFWSCGASNDDFLKPYQITAAMSMVTKKVESMCHIIAFDSKTSTINISPKDRMDTVMKKVIRNDWSSTDCSLPMRWACANNIDVDLFVVYTDNDTNTGRMHPFQALKEYRRKMNIPAKMAVVATQSRNFSIADPSDSGMMDFVGFDGTTPAALSSFALS